MANTEGISDENLAKLLTINLEDHQRPQPSQTQAQAQAQAQESPNNAAVNPNNKNSKRIKFPKGMLERQRMMDEFEHSGEISFQPSAKVIRSSKRPGSAGNAPDIKSAAKNRGSNNSTVSRRAHIIQTPITEDDDVPETSKPKIPAPSQGASAHIPPPVLRPGSILERKNQKAPKQSEEPKAATKKVSKFKLRQQQKSTGEDGGGAPTLTPNSKHAGARGVRTGFPSFDIPVGALTRKGKVMKTGTGTHDDESTNPTMLPPSFNPSIPHQRNDNGSAGGTTMKTTTTSKTNARNVNRSTSTNSAMDDADKILAGMSQTEIQDSAMEIKSMLSPETIEFLKKRHTSKKQATDKATKDADHMMKVEKMSTSEKANVVDDTVEEKRKSGNDVNFKKMSPSQEAAAIDALVVEKVKDEEEMIRTHEDDSELEAASKLLRSTAIRQRILGAKNMCRLLDALVYSDNGEPSSSIANSSDYPELLPVALRCILDMPSPHKHPQLITYTLRCIHNLMFLFVHPSHRIGSKSLKGLGNGPDAIFQQEFMHDAVPVPSAAELYSKQGGVQLGKSSMGDGCYSTNASAESAASDAKSFYSDPAWILLSKMRIIPCLSHILLAHNRISLQSKAGGSLSLSVEAVEAICGILAMLSLRSPGAAAAIAQNQHLLPSLISLTLEPGTEANETGFVVDTKLAFPVIYLCCILCRQSRSAAKSLEPVINKVVSIIAIDAAHHDEYRLQQWCIILWRTMLRYGLALSHLSTILPLSISRLVSDSKNPDLNIGTEFLSAYSVICQCVKIVTLHNGFHSVQNKSVLSDSDRETLAMSGIWFSSHAQNCADDIMKDLAITSDSVTSNSMKRTNSKLRFLSLYFDASSPSDIVGAGTQSKNLAFVPLITVETILAVLNNIVDSGLFTLALKQIFTSPATEISEGMVKEANACGLVETFFSSTRILSDKLDKMFESREEGKVSSDVESEFSLLGQNIFQISLQTLKDAQPNSDRFSQLPRMNWVHRAHCALGIFLSNSFAFKSTSRFSSLGTIPSHVQSFILEVIGKLQRGDESRAALLFSQNSIFTSGRLEHDDKIMCAYPVQDVMMRELCSTARSQSQLDHSFKLDGRPGLTIAGKGHFALDSLRIETDNRDQSKDSEASVSDSLVLPLGVDWIWKLLSSTIISDDSGQYSRGSISRATGIINSTLQFIVFIEEHQLHCATLIPPGAKMYFLLNACFNPEKIISNEVFETLFLKAFTTYQQKMLKEETENARQFIVTCYKHSSIAMKSNVDDEADYEKLMNLFFDVGGANKNDSSLSSKHLKALDDFVEDLTGPFIDFGAQYELFVHAVRLLLLPGMPMRIRTRVLGKLEDILHLLTTESESADASGTRLQQTLTKYFLGGVPFIDNSKREDGSFLDTLSRILKTFNFHHAERRSGFFYFFAIGCLARTLASSSIRCECGTKAMQQRMQGMDVSIQNNIVEVAKDCIRENCGSSKELAGVVTQICCGDQPSGGETKIEFESVVRQLRELHQTINA